jgi:hypothetical protein
MTDGHIQRLLLAESDFDAAQAFRAVAEEALKLYAEALESDPATGIDRTSPAYRAWAKCKRELKELNRVCLRHTARRLDAAMRADGKESEMESQVMLFDITHPVRELV